MKKTIITVVMAMILTLGINVTEVKALEDISNSMMETRVKTLVAKQEYEVGEGLIEKETKVRAIQYSVTYRPLVDGIYDICTTFTIYNKYKYEYHLTYDAFDDFELNTYGIVNGRRMDYGDVDDIIEAKFPELVW